MALTAHDYSPAELDLKIILPPEFELLCCTIGPRLILGRAAAILHDGINWRVLTDLATAHGVRPRLIRVIRESFSAQLPPETKQEFEDFQRIHLVRSLHAGKELAAISDALSQTGVRHAWFKGITLAATLYGSIAGREFVDLDVIVDKDNIAAAERILEARGYAPRHGDATFRTAFLAYQHQYIFVNPETRLMIDLHWDFSGKGDFFPLQTSEIWRNLIRVPVANHDIPTLGMSELAILLAGHGTKEGWASLNWVADFAEFLHKNFDLDWVALQRRAQKNKCGRSILLAGLLASKLFQIDMSAELMRLIADDGRVYALAKSAINRLCPDAIVSTQRQSWPKLYQRWPRQLWAAWVMLSVRTTGDHKAMPLPRQLWHIYYLTRPIRLGLVVLSMGLRRLADRVRGSF